jgi:hypothetical protein
MKPESAKHITMMNAENVLLMKFVFIIFQKIPEIQWITGMNIKFKLF